MKTELTNSNYCATIVLVDKVLPIEGSDNIVSAIVYGYNIIIAKNTDLSKPMILFTTESKISNKYLSENNLYSSPNLNNDVTVKGYIGNSGRVRAIKLRGASSNALLMPVSSLSGADKIEVGTSFNSINGELLVEKYEVPVESTPSNKVRGTTKKFNRIDAKNFPEHFDTENYFRNEFKYKNDDELIITQKLHGTSVRIGNVLTRKKPSLLERIFRTKNLYEYDMIAGSRRVIKDIKSNINYNHYYEVEKGELDIYNRAMSGISIPKDFIIYGEIIGYNGSGEIQKGYTYGLMSGQFKLFIYRVTFINRDGLQFDLPWKQVKEFCNTYGLLYVPELSIVKKSDFKVENYIDKILCREYDCVFSNVVDEGVCVRYDGVVPYVTKAKSPLFLEHETKMLDVGEIISS